MKHSNLRDWKSQMYSWQIARCKTISNPFLRHRKEELFSTLSGTVLEIGPGLGNNLEFYPKGIRWIGVEPNPYVYHDLIKLGQEQGISLDVRLCPAEQLDISDFTIDAVVSTFVLCSVSNPKKSINEIIRVLKPGGRFVFIEHVASIQSSGLRKLQNIFRPVWTALAANCHPDRETGKLIEQAGFVDTHIEYFFLPRGLTSPHIAGYAIKR